MKLRKKKKIIKQFSEYKAELVLHGHLHENREYFRKRIKFLNCGGTVLGDDKFLKLNEITVSEKNISNKIITLVKPNAPSSLQKELHFPIGLKKENITQFCLN